MKERKAATPVPGPTMIIGAGLSDLGILKVPFLSQTGI